MLVFRRFGSELSDRCLADIIDLALSLNVTLHVQAMDKAKKIALRYERYVKGALSFFNNPSNVAFDNRITNIDLHDLNANMRVFGMLTALEAVCNRMYHNFERGVTTWLCIDEAQSLFGHPAIIGYFSKFWAEGRKFNLISTGITQNSVYMLEHEEARNMVLNSDFILLFKQSPLDRKAWADLLDLSDQESGRRRVHQGGQSRCRRSRQEGGRESLRGCRDIGRGTAGGRHRRGHRLRALRGGGGQGLMVDPRGIRQRGRDHHGRLREVQELSRESRPTGGSRRSSRSRCSPARPCSHAPTSQASIADDINKWLCGVLHDTCNYISSKGRTLISAWWKAALNVERNGLSK